MSRPNHFEIPVDDPDRAENFYREAFGWEFNRYEGAPSYYGLAKTGEENPGINGALYQREGDSRVIVTMGVESVAASLDQIESLGGTVVQGRQAVPGMGWYATCDDTEGNRIGVFEVDSNAG
ncbi:MAG: VOC family protein [Candidatus Dormibacteria bacterium]